MRSMLPSLLRTTALAIGLTASTLAMAQTAICYNCPPEWADWGSQIKAIKAKTGVTVPPDNKNSGQSLAQLVAEKARPVADVTYLGVTFGSFSNLLHPRMRATGSAVLGAIYGLIGQGVGPLALGMLRPVVIIVLAALVLAIVMANRLAQNAPTSSVMNSHSAA